MDLRDEAKRQLDNDELRQDFAENANSFHVWLTETRAVMVESQGDLEDQLKVIQEKSKEIQERKEALSIVEDLGAQMEEALILDNK
jgi:spectrin alpha